MKAKKHFTRTLHSRHFVWEDYPKDGIYCYDLYLLDNSL